MIFVRVFVFLCRAVFGVLGCEVYRFMVRGSTFSPVLLGRLVGSSDGVVLLGAGSSLTAVELGKASHSLHIGVNFFLLHEFLPDFWVVEIPHQSDRRELLLDIARKYRNEFSGLKGVVLKDSWVLSRHGLCYYQFIAKLSRILDCPFIIPRGCKISRMSYSGFGLEARFFRSICATSTLFPQLGCTMDWLMAMSCRYGAESLRLYGVDLMGGYFYDHAHRCLRVGAAQMAPRSIQKGVLHQTAYDPCAVPLPIAVELIRKRYRNVNIVRMFIDSVVAHFRPLRVKAL